MLYTTEKSPEILICKELQGFYLKSGGQNAPKDFNLLNIIKLQLTENMVHRLVRKGKNFLQHKDTNYKKSLWTERHLYYLSHSFESNPVHNIGFFISSTAELCTEMC